MSEPKTFDRNAIERAWSWHEWSPPWLPGRVTALLKRRMLSRLVAPGICTLDDGRRMLVTLDDHVQCTIARNGEWEGLIHRAVRRFVAAGETVLDVGGHVGYSTLQFADWIGDSGRVFVFEPIHANVRRIDANLRLNGLRHRVEILESAVSDAPGVVGFAESSALNSGMGAIAHGTGNRQVAAVSLDAWTAERCIHRIALLKLDIEGAEALALRGMKRLLAERRIRALMMEFHPQELPKFGCSVESLLDRLREPGYRLAFWHEEGRFDEGPMPPDCGYLLATAPE